MSCNPQTRSEKVIITTVLQMREKGGSVKKHRDVTETPKFKKYRRK